MEELILEGKAYFGRFKAEQEIESYRFSGDSGERLRTRWKGQGCITEIATDEKVRFLLNFTTKAPQINNLESAIVHFESRVVSFPEQPKTQDRAAVKDLILKEMYRDAKEKLNDHKTIIPTVSPPLIYIDDLLLAH